MMLADSFNRTESPEPDLSEQAVSVRHSIVLALLRNDPHSDWDNVIFQAKHLAAFVLRGEVQVPYTPQVLRDDSPALPDDEPQLDVWHSVRKCEPAVPDDGLNKKPWYSEPLMARVHLTRAVCQKHGGIVPYHDMVDVGGLRVCKQCALDDKKIGGTD